jgi:ABC-2 type transport system ATP-binding protein
MPQLFTLYPDLTAAENVNFVASLFGLLWPRRRRRVHEVLRTVDLWDARNRRATALSGGMQRRLELACALVHEPELLFLDEPTAGIDPLLRARVWNELHRLKSLGRTLLVTTQYVTEAEECDMVALIAEGQLVALDEPENLRKAATGGDLVQVETAARFAPSKLVSLPRVRGVSQQGPRSFRVTVDDAGAATPDVVAAVAAAGGEVVSAREYRLSFDEVFAELVSRKRGAPANGEAKQEAAPEQDKDR